MARLPAKGRHERREVRIPRRCPPTRPFREKHALLPRRMSPSPNMDAIKRDMEGRFKGTAKILSKEPTIGEINGQNNQWGITISFPFRRNSPRWQVWFHVPKVHNKAESFTMSEAIGATVVKGRTSVTQSNYQRVWMAIRAFSDYKRALDWLEMKGPKFNKSIQTK